MAPVVGKPRKASQERLSAHLAGAATKRKLDDQGPHGSGRTAPTPSPPTAEDHTAVLDAAIARVEKLEPRLAGIVETILRRYGDTAARNFTEHATRHVTAAGPPTQGDGWTSPFPDQLINVNALVAEILAKTQPVREALIRTTMSAALAQAGINFDVSNPLVAGQIANTGAQVTSIADTTRANIMNIIGQAVQAGLSVPQTSTLIRTGMRSASATRATTISRTEMGRAVNGGSLTATRMVAAATGANYNKTWHCVAPWTRVSGEGVLAVVRKPYEGELVTVTCKPTRDRADATADFPGDSLVGESFGAKGESQLSRVLAEGAGSAARLPGSSMSPGRFTVTSDHLVLTGRGWIAAGLLQPGDNVVGRSLGQEHGETPDVDDIEATAEEIFDTALGAAAAVGVMSLPVYLDDGSVGEKIDIPAADGGLRGRLNAALSEPLREFMLAVSDVRLDELFRDGSTVNRRIGHRRATSGSVATSAHRPENLGLALVAEQVGLTLAPQLHTVLNEDSLDEPIGDSESPAESLHRLAPLVRVDEIVQVERRSWSGHVYDVTTLSGWFFADGYVAHNTAPGAAYPRHEDYDGLDGQTVGLEEEFQVGESELMYPGDPGGDPGDTIMCRCSISYVTPQGEQEADADAPPVLDTMTEPGGGPDQGGGLMQVGPPADDTVSIGASRPVDPEYVARIQEEQLDLPLRDMRPRKAIGKKLFHGPIADTGGVPGQEGLHWHVGPDGQYAWDAERADFQEQIIARFFEGKEPLPEGATPKNFFTAGGGASGKGESTFIVDGVERYATKTKGLPVGVSASQSLVNDKNWIVVDPDEIKKMLPEFQELYKAGDVYAANGVHEESSDIAKRIIKLAEEKHFNIVLDGTGSNESFLNKKIWHAKTEVGAETQVTMVSAPTNRAIERSIARATKKDSPSYGRFVSIQALKEAHKGASAALAAWKDSPLIDQWRVMDSSGDSLRVIAAGGEGRVNVFDSQAFAETLAKADEVPGSSGAVVKEVAPIVLKTPPIDYPDENSLAAWADRSRQYEAKLAGVQKDDLREYTIRARGYNSVLRGDDESLSDKEFVDKYGVSRDDAYMIDTNVYEGLAKAEPLPEGTMLWRGVNPFQAIPELKTAYEALSATEREDFDLQRELIHDWLHANQDVGSVIRPGAGGFQSFSLDPAIAASFGGYEDTSLGLAYRVVDAKTGAPVEAVSTVPHEHEILAPPEQNYRVAAIHEEDIYSPDYYGDSPLTRIVVDITEEPIGEPQFLLSEAEPVVTPSKADFSAQHEASKQWSNDLSKNEKKAVKGYTTHDNGPINAAMRGDTETWDATHGRMSRDDALVKAANIETAIDKAGPLADGTSLYRGFDPYKIPQIEENWRRLPADQIWTNEAQEHVITDWLDQNQPVGSVIRPGSGGVQSFTTRPDLAAPFGGSQERTGLVYRVTGAKKGAPIYSVSGNKSEEEVLVRHNQNYRVTQIHTETLPGYPYPRVVVDLEEIGPLSPEGEPMLAANEAVTNTTSELDKGGKADIDAALDTISRQVMMPELGDPRMPISQIKEPPIQARIVGQIDTPGLPPGSTAEGLFNPTTNQIQVRRLASDRYAVTVHEFGHALDHVVGVDIGAGNATQAIEHAGLEDWAKAVTESPTYNMIHDAMMENFKEAEIAGREVTGKDIIYVDGPEPYYAGSLLYVLNPQEMFARSFVQYMSQTDDRLAAHVSEQLGRTKQSPGMWYWDPDEFAPIAAAMHDWLDRSGLLATGAVDPAG